MSNHSATKESVASANEEEIRFDLGEILANENYVSEAPRIEAKAPTQIEGIVIGQLVGQDSSGQPLIDFANNFAPAPIAAQTVVAFEQQDFGRQAAVMFEGGDLNRPILMGLLQEPSLVTKPTSAAKSLPLSIHADDERIELKADREIVLKCGKASITLTRAGKVLIRGAFLLSRSSGVNRIKGGSVQIN